MDHARRGFYDRAPLGLLRPVSDPCHMRRRGAAGRRRLPQLALCGSWAISRETGGWGCVRARFHLFTCFLLPTSPAPHTRVRRSEGKELERRHMGEERASGHESFGSLEEEGRRSSDTYAGGGEKTAPGARTVTGTRGLMRQPIVASSY